MKKKILGAFLVAMIALIATFNVNLNINADNGLSAVSLANLEALAQGENGGTRTCSNYCGGEKCGTFTDNDGSSWPVYYC